jgi:hypothetical protein
MFVEQLLGFTSKFYSLLGYSNKIKNHQTKESQISQHLLLTTPASKVCFSSSFPGLMELEIKQWQSKESEDLKTE